MYRVFLYDGTFEGFLTCAERILSVDIDIEKLRIENKSTYQPMFFDTAVFVNANKGISNMLKERIIKKADKNTFKKIYYCFLSEVQNKEMYIYKYIKLVLKQGKKVKYFYHDDVVNFVEKVSKSVSREIGKYMGLMRFNESEDGLLYAQFEPVNDILVPISYFFRGRLANFRWIIHDKKRGKLSFYENGRIRFLKKADLKTAFSNEDLLYQNLWKTYFKTMTIEERKNLKLQRQNMPKKYWKYLTEKK
ncbi:TIGR03915 family putative DNA repair protein [Caldicellulosiruptor morganii]|uniref:TIGR03915 family putative DNA repair protein n=1 Tax=Caldicellulosiruptor morganii TaxID=1387555 RepID=A0ABY7BS73_9FIRM|nr:TIGR03915 family putative DNA repair protein [Caldicellulosiruptor morganii]WAM34521.1 TIGR03915 family putative DNA repair protein [Caldicellulosiruptor morganii]